MSLNLGHTADVAGDHRPGSGVENMLRFTLTQFFGNLRLFEVVRAGRTAADIPLGHFQQGNVGNTPQQLAGGDGDALRLSQMAGVVVGQLERSGQGRRFFQANLVQQNRNILDLGGKGLSLSLFNHTLEQQRVLLHAGAATGRVGDDGIHLGHREGFEVVAGQRSGLGRRAGVHRQAATAGLVFRNEGFDTVLSQNPQRGPVDLRGQDLLGAAGQQGHPRPDLAFGRVNVR